MGKLIKIFFRYPGDVVSEKKKGMKNILRVGAIALAGVGILLALSNPGKKAYQEYATEQLGKYLKEKVCEDAPQIGGGNFLRHQCQTLVDTSRPQMEQLISSQTKRNNFLLFSIYQSDLSLAAPLPSYHVQTLGILHNFYIYKAEKTNSNKSDF